MERQNRWDIGILHHQNINRTGLIDIDDVLVSILKEEYEKQKRDEEYYGEFYKKYYSEFQLLFSGSKK